ncbi:hypothetical protein DNK34_21510 [Pseudomonas dryadis]|uniref:PAS domain-containing protein n=1 Tax=Phytopseudomonas dryadis TaxID=2487520 RepID=A0ABY1Z4S5_9GAMM|nr:hypothetical protein DNK34_21510 [Pseudomonas dryadis]TBV14779.1 hypothetical protein DNK41_19550 [Pseudomonas sp. FRB 230]
MFDRLEERVVGGTGIGVEPLVLDLSGAVHLDFCAQIKGAWAEWSLRPETAGELTRPQMERLVCRTWLRDGESLAQKIMGPVVNYRHLTAVPFALELLEPDYLPFELNDTSKGIIQGIERDAWRRIRAFHLLKAHPGDLGHGIFQQTKRVEAERIIHVANRKRIGQNRGVPLLHATLIRLAGTDYLLTPHGILRTETSGITSAGVLLTYTKLAASALQLLNGSPVELEIFIAGLNDAQSGEPYSLHLRRVKFGMLSELPVFGQEYLKLEGPAELLADPTVLSNDISKFCEMNIVSKAA